MKNKLLNFLIDFFDIDITTDSDAVWIPDEKGFWKKVELNELYL